MLSVPHACLTRSTTGTTTSGLKVLLKLLRRPPTLRGDGMDCAMTRCHALLVLLRALESKKLRRAAIDNHVFEVLTMVR